MLTDLIKDREGRLIITQVVKALPEEELRLLHVGRSIRRVPLHDALELYGRTGISLLLVKSERVSKFLRGWPSAGGAGGCPVSSTEKVISWASAGPENSPRESRATANVSRRLRVIG